MKTKRPIGRGKFRIICRGRLPRYTRRQPYEGCPCDPINDQPRGPETPLWPKRNYQL